MGTPEQATPAVTGFRRWVREVAVTTLLFGVGLLLFFYDFALVARQELRPVDLLVAYDLNAPSLVFYSKRQVAIVGRGEEAGFQRLAASYGRLFIVAKAAAETRLGSAMK